MDFCNKIGDSYSILLYEVVKYSIRCVNVLRRGRRLHYSGRFAPMQRFDTPKWDEVCEKETNNL